MGWSAVKYLVAKDRWHHDELLSCLGGKEGRERKATFLHLFAEITPQDIEVFIRGLFTHFYVDSLMYGNITKDVGVPFVIVDDMEKYSSFLASNGLYDDGSTKVP